MDECATVARRRQTPSHPDTPAVQWVRPVNLQSGGTLLLKILRDPRQLADLSAGAWGELMPLAKFTGLWPQIACRVRRLGLTDSIPPPVRPHLQSAQFTAAAHEATMRWEVERLQAALIDVPGPIILLKGVAYLLSGFEFAQGRSFQDVDILVPQRWLAPVETALRQHGWVFSEERPLHELYFRTWLQELAPMWHYERQVQLDIHHTIIPPKDRIPLDPHWLYNEAVSLDAGPLRVLAPADMFLHAATNLFRTGEFTYLLRDLWDMHGMLERFARQPDFWDLVLERAEKLHLTRPCFYALRYLSAICQTPVPASLAAAAARWRPNPIATAVADSLVRRTLFPRSLDRVDRMRDWALTLREYWPPPRWRTIFSFLFWRKRLPSKAPETNRGGDSDGPADDHGEVAR
jgi:hypothetical protein